MSAIGSLLFGLIVGQAFAAPAATSQKLNIHIKVAKSCNAQAVGYNAGATQILGADQTVDFVTGVAEPHITLYLTNFNNDDVPALQEYIDNFTWGEDCVVNLDHARDAGTGYVFWDPDVRTPECLTTLAQEIMDNTGQFIVTPTEDQVSSWIMKLDEPEKSERIENYMQYGTSNIGIYYEPHVTYAAVAYGSDGDFDAVADVAGTNPGEAKCSYTVAEIALGQTGPSGTVLKGQDLASTTKIGKEFAQ
eukprot:Awhi_evm1s15789